MNRNTQVNEIGNAHIEEHEHELYRVLFVDSKHFQHQLISIFDCLSSSIYYAYGYYYLSIRISRLLFTCCMNYLLYILCAVNKTIIQQGGGIVCGLSQNTA